MPPVVESEARAWRAWQGGRKKNERSVRLFAGAFAAIAAAFLASTLYGHIRASEVDRQTAMIRTNSLPSVEHLAAARGALRHLEVASEEYVHRDGNERSDAERSIGRARDELHDAFAAELSTEMYPGERELAGSTTNALRDLDGRLARLYELSSRDPVEAYVYAHRDVRDAVEGADLALDRLMSLNAGHVSAEATQIADLSAGSIRLAFRLDLACVALAAAAALVALRALGRQRVVEQAHARALEVHAEMLKARADELELFAKRVAHDLLNPLSALSFTLSAVRRNAERGLAIDGPLARAGACLKRSQKLVDNVLDFARSSAPSPAGERTSLRDSLAGVMDEIRSDADAETEIVVQPWNEDVIVPCAPGILASVLSNLLRNAVKYGGGAGHPVTVRVSPRERDVRVEVEDTGPGLPPGLSEHVFEPYVRAPNNPKPGLGLGLATARRFIEAHGGAVGVRTAPGSGSTFWFELPRSPSRLGRGDALIPIGNGATGS